MLCFKGWNTRNIKVLFVQIINMIQLLPNHEKVNNMRVIHMILIMPGYVEYPSCLMVIITYCRKNRTTVFSPEP